MTQYVEEWMDVLQDEVNEAARVLKQEERNRPVAQALHAEYVREFMRVRQFSLADCTIVELMQRMATDASMLESLSILHNEWLEYRRIVAQCANRLYFNARCGLNPMFRVQFFNRITFANALVNRVFDQYVADEVDALCTWPLLTHMGHTQHLISSIAHPSAQRKHNILARIAAIPIVNMRKQVDEFTQHVHHMQQQPCTTAHDVSTQIQQIYDVCKQTCDFQFHDLMTSESTTSILQRVNTLVLQHANELHERMRSVMDFNALQLVVLEECTRASHFSRAHSWVVFKSQVSKCVKTDTPHLKLNYNAKYADTLKQVLTDTRDQMQRIRETSMQYVMPLNTRDQLCHFLDRLYQNITVDMSAITEVTNENQEDNEVAAAAAAATIHVYDKKDIAKNAIEFDANHMHTGLLYCIRSFMRDIQLQVATQSLLNHDNAQQLADWHARIMNIITQHIQMHTRDLLKLDECERVFTIHTAYKEVYQRIHTACAEDTRQTVLVVLEPHMKLMTQIQAALRSVNNSTRVSTREMIVTRSLEWPSTCENSEVPTRVAEYALHSRFVSQCAHLLRHTHNANVETERARGVVDSFIATRPAQFTFHTMCELIDSIIRLDYIAQLQD